MKPLAEQLLDAQQCGVYQSVRTAGEVERAAQAAGLNVFRLDLRNARDKNGFLSEIAKALNFPDYFRSNWDALDECLRDLNWLPAKTGFVLIFENAEHFRMARKDFEVAVDVLDSAAESWKSEGRPFWALFARSKLSDYGLRNWPTL